MSGEEAFADRLKVEVIGDLLRLDIFMSISSPFERLPATLSRKLHLASAGT
nr:hypothetical protein [Pseudomonas sp. BIGb0427]